MSDYLTISWKNYSFKDDDSIAINQLSLDKNDDCLQFKKEIANKIGIPHEYIQIFCKEKEVKENEKMKNYYNETKKILFKKTDPNKKIEGIIKLKLIDILNPQKQIILEFPNKKQTIGDLKVLLTQKAGLSTYENKYLAIFRCDKNRNPEELFDEKTFEQLEIKFFDCLHYILKTITPDIAPKIGRATISVKIEYNGGIYSFKIYQQKTFNELLRMFCNTIGTETNKIALIYGGKIVNGRETIYSMNIIEGTQFSAIDVTN